MILSRNGCHSRAPSSSLAGCFAAAAHHRAAPLRRAPLSPRASAAATTVNSRQLLDDLAAAGLSPCRFVVVGNGAILESVGDWCPVRYNTNTTRGTVATISNTDKSFEAHFVLSKLSEARFALVDKPGNLQ